MMQSVSRSGLCGSEFNAYGPVFRCAQNGALALLVQAIVAGD